MSEVTGRHPLATPIVTRLRGADGVEREETVTELTIRPMVVGDVRAMSKVADETEKGLLLMQRLTGLDAHTLDKMGMEDFAAVSTVIEGFLPDGLATGMKPPS